LIKHNGDDAPQNLLSITIHEQISRRQKGNSLNPWQTPCKVTVAMRSGREDKRLWTEQEGKSNIILSEVTCEAISTYRAMWHKYHGTVVRQKLVPCQLLGSGECLKTN